MRFLERSAIYLLRFINLICVLNSLSSCSQHYFDRPQPIDNKNIYAFPAPFRGIWVDGDDSLIVAKFYFANIEYTDNTIPYPTSDTTRYALLKDNKAYPYDSLLQQIGGVGYPYEIKNDSVYFTTREILEAQLGRKAILREVGDQFVLNVKNNNQWWELFLMSITDQGKILIRYPNIENMAEQGIIPVLSNNNEDYFEVQWTAKQLQRMIDQDIFADTLLLLDQQYIE